MDGNGAQAAFNLHLRGKVKGLRLEFHIPAAPSSLQECGRGVRYKGSSSVPISPFRRVDRSPETVKDLERNPETRLLEKLQVRRSLREGGTAASKLEPLHDRPAGFLRGGHAAHRGSHAGAANPDPPKASKLMSLTNRSLRGIGRLVSKSGQFVADCFAGEAGISRAARRMGFEVKANLYEIQHGSAGDLTIRSASNKLVEQLKDGLVLALFMGPPCSTFSIAFDKGTPIRSSQHPWGLPDVPDIFSRET